MFISPEFSLSLCPFTRLLRCVTSIIFIDLLKRRKSAHLLSPASFPLHTHHDSKIEIHLYLTLLRWSQMSNYVELNYAGSHNVSITTVIHFGS